MNVRVLAYGGRGFRDRAAVYAALDLVKAVFPVAVLIHGGAAGADSLAHDWAEARGVAVDEYPADWVRYGRKAGPVRNQQMLTEGRPDFGVEFPGGAGTRDMRSRLDRFGIPVVTCDATGEQFRAFMDRLFLAEFFS